MDFFNFFYFWGLQERLRKFDLLHLSPPRPLKEPCLMLAARTLEDHDPKTSCRLLWKTTKHTK